MLELYTAEIKGYRRLKNVDVQSGSEEGRFIDMVYRLKLVIYVGNLVRNGKGIRMEFREGSEGALEKFQTGYCLVAYPLEFPLGFGSQQLCLTWTEGPTVRN